MSTKARNATNWHVYGLADSDGVIRYVGFTHDVERRQREHINEAIGGRPTPKDDWVRSLLSAGRQPKIIILETGEGAGSVKAEIQWIDQLRSLELLNVTVGGDGTKGYHHSEETRQKIGESNRRAIALGLKKPSYHRVGAKATPETIARLRSSHLGKKATEEQKQRQSAALIGRHPSTYRPEEVRRVNRERARRLRERRIAMGLLPYKGKR